MSATDPFEKPPLENTQDKVFFYLSTALVLAGVLAVLAGVVYMVYRRQAPEAVGPIELTD